MFKQRLVPYHCNAANRLIVADAECSMDEIVPIYVFYHIYCGPNNWQEIVQSQFAKMKDSGLLDACNRLIICVLGGEEGDRHAAIKILASQKTELVLKSEDGTNYEFPLLDKMWEMAKNEKFYAVYFHTKGSSYDVMRYKSFRRSFSSFNRNSKAWREMMEYFVMENWKMACSALFRGYDAFGCMWQENHHSPHFSGNFWWTKSEHILDLPQPNRTNRFEAEFWIGRSKSGCIKVYSPIDLTVSPYTVFIPKSLYTKPWWHYRNMLFSLRHWFVSLWWSKFIV